MIRTITTTLTWTVVLSAVALQSQERKLLSKTLRGALDRITDSQRIAVMLDRRVDPDQEIEFSASKVPLDLMINQFVGKYGAATCLVDSVLYVGPSDTCQLLPTLVELRRDEVRALPIAKQRTLPRTSPWKWKRLASPRDLIQQLESEYGLQINGKENMPHDLWSASDLPPLDFASKLSLLLAGFHVTFAMASDGESVQITAMPKTASLSRKYNTGTRTTALSKTLSERFTGATIRPQGNSLVVEAPWEVHDAIDRLLKGETVRAAPADEGKKHYTLTVENKAVGGVIRGVGQHLGKKVVFDVKVERRLIKEVSLNVKEVSLNELLTAVLSPAKLKYEIDGDTIRVFD